MKSNNLLKSIKLTLTFCVVIGLFYVLVLWLFAKVMGPGEDGRMELVSVDGRVVGAANVGQTFDKDIYFWGRPSAVNYDGGASGGSNKGVTNEQYLSDVETRIDSFLVHHPYLQRGQIPVEMVTASASGLDPDITPESAYIQVKRVAQARGLDEAVVNELVNKTIQRPLFGLLGPDRVNVLDLNRFLEELTNDTLNSESENGESGR